MKNWSEKVNAKWLANLEKDAENFDKEMDKIAAKVDKELEEAAEKFDKSFIDDDD